MTKVNVEVIKEFEDQTVNNKFVPVGTKLTLPIDRANALLGDNKYREPFVKLIEPSKEKVDK